MRGGDSFFNITPGKQHALPDTMYEKYFDKNKQYMRYGVHDDGSCFFHTICAAKNIDNYRQKTTQERINIGRLFRKKICKKVSKQYWKDIWNRRGMTKRLPEVHIIKHMLGDYATWADVYTILHVMDKMDLNMIFVDLTSGNIYCGVRGVQSGQQESVLVAWVNRVHFEPIFRLSLDDNGKINQADAHSGTFVYPINDDFIGNLMNRYHSELCVHRNDINDIM